MKNLHRALQRPRRLLVSSNTREYGGLLPIQGQKAKFRSFDIKKQEKMGMIAKQGADASFL